MPDKGKIMSQTFYERQSKLLNLYKELFVRKEMNDAEVVTALKMIGFSEKIAANRARDWTALNITVEPETERIKNRRIKERSSLEKYVQKMLLGRKYYLRLQFIQGELSKDEIVKKLMKLIKLNELERKENISKEKIAREMVNEWETFSQQTPNTE